MVPTDLYLDHVLIAVRDLEEASAYYDNLGFTLTPPGVRPGRGHAQTSCRFRRSVS